MNPQPTFQDVVGCEAALYEWAESYDAKDRDRLSKCITPTLRIDYRRVLNKLWEAMPADDFVEMALDTKFIGNPRLKTQHLVGASKWLKTSETEMTGHHQMRVAHLRYADEDLTEVLAKARVHGKATVWYRKVDEVWKFAGIEPDLRWSDGEHDKVFQEGQEKFGETAN
ncbi:MAG: hypothetical protein Q9172_005529 [Xanthocarpia lactea]